MILLSEGEIAAIVVNSMGAKIQGSIFDCSEAVAKAAAKKVIRWGDEECTGHPGYTYSLHRRQCGLCWQDLQKEAE